MRQCASCRFLIGDNEVGCTYCGRIAADAAANGKAVVATFTRSPGVEVARVSNALAVPDEPIRRRAGVATLPVPADHAYPAPYPRPWNDLAPPPAVPEAPRRRSLRRVLGRRLAP